MTSNTVKGCLQVARTAGQYPCQSAIDADILIESLKAEVERLTAELESCRAIGAKNAIKLAKHIQDNERLIAKNSVLQEATDDFISQVADCESEHHVCHQLTILAKVVQENLDALKTGQESL